MATEIEIPDMITVGSLAERLMLPVSKLIAELMKNGVLVTVNEQIDFDTAQIIVEELGLDVVLAKQHAESLGQVPVRKRQPAGDSATPRPPVVAVMGHVDHGKTTLLDFIRGAHVARTEAGGITQHISAYQIEHNGRKITFLDTPGHEAFAAIREHSAQLTDIAVIVVAADDGVKPQTVEAIRFARKANARIIVAINKIDKPDANASHVKQQLSDQQLLVEEWGGDIVAIEVSGKTGQGVPQLLDMLLLVADVEELRADTTGLAAGLIIEAHVEQGRGPVAHGLVEVGTLRKSDFVVAGSTYAKLRNLESTDGSVLVSATPSTPVVMTGFKVLPEFGDEFTVVRDEKQAKSLAAIHAAAKGKNYSNKNITSSDLIKLMNRNRDTSELNVVVKADAQGSLTSVIDSLKSLDTQEVALRVIGSGIGHITENDIYMAQAGNAIVYGFNIAIQSNVKQLAAREKVNVRLYNIIYELLDDAREELGKLLAPQVVENELGRLSIRKIFKTTKSEVICGGEVTKGKLEVPSLARISRGEEVLGEVEVTNLKRGPVDAKEVFEGEMCGLSFKTKHRIDLQEGDRLDLFRREVVERHL